MRDRTVISTTVAALIQRIGCMDAVVEILGTRWGHSVSKGTISKKMSGDLDWTVADVVAIEDAVGDYPVTRLLMRRTTATEASSVPLVAQAAIISKECGEALSAVLGAVSSCQTQDQARAITEIDEAIAALKQARANLEQGRA